jgi:Protein of unknown function (DUF3014)
MAHDDLPLRSSQADPAGPQPRTSSPTRWIVLGAAALIAVSLLALWWMSRARPVVAPPVPTTAEVEKGIDRPARQQIDLPSLDGSDGLLRELVSALSQHPMLARLLATKGIVRGATIAVVQIGDGQTPAVPLAVLRPDSRLQIRGTTSGPIHPDSYARWNGAAAALTSVSPTDAAQLYVNVKPLFDEAYRELGQPGGDFDAAIARAIRTVSEAPDPSAAPVLLQRPGYFEHDDPALRALQPVQKQLLLLGPQNRRAIVQWLHEFARALDIKIPS